MASKSSITCIMEFGGQDYFILLIDVVVCVLFFDELFHVGCLFSIVNPAVSDHIFILVHISVMRFYVHLMITRPNILLTMRRRRKDIIECNACESMSDKFDCRRLDAHAN